MRQIKNREHRGKDLTINMPEYQSDSVKFIDRLAAEMVRYFSGDPKRIQHFLKVHAFAGLIGKSEGLNERTQLILEAAALVHDIGIKPAEQKFGRCDGKLQESEGPAPAQELLAGIEADAELIERVCWLVAHHHSYSEIDGADYQILIEADFLVNMFEDGMSAEQIQSAFEKIFRTETGKRLCREMYGI